MFQACPRNPGAQFQPGLFELHVAADRQMAAYAKPAFDFRVLMHGSVSILNPLNEGAEDWMAEHIGSDAMAWGQKGVVVEPRFLPPILQGLVEDGYSVEVL